MQAPGPQILTPWVFLPGIGLIFIGFALFTRAGRLRLPMRPLLAGMGLWPAAALFLAAGPLNPLILIAVSKRIALSSPAVWLSVAAVTALVEFLAVWLAARFSRLKEADWNAAYAVGVGFASMALILGGMVAVIQVIKLSVLQAGTISPELQTQLNQFANYNSPAVGLASLLDAGVLALAHILTIAWTLYGVRTRSAKWLVSALAFKFMLYAFNGYAQYGFGLNTPAKIGQAGLVTLVYGLFAWRYLRPLPKMFQAARAPTGNKR